MQCNDQPYSMTPLRRTWDKGSRHSRGYGSAWDRLRKTILQRDCYLCQQCKRQGRITALCAKPYDHAVDHITPRAKGGTDDPDNLESLCGDCHDRKSAEEAAEAQGRTLTAPKPTIGLDGWPQG